MPVVQGKLLLQRVGWLWARRKMLLVLTHNEIREQYLGSYLGVLWSLLRPLSFILVIWSVFTFGLRAEPVSQGAPFVLWLLCAMVPWLFFAEGLRKAVNAVTASAYLVKKVAFPVGILPLVKVLAAFVVHCLLLLVLLVVALAHGYLPTLYWLQLPYYIGCVFVLLLGAAWLTSALRVFVKDLNEATSLMVQFGFWLTPVFWSLDLVPADKRWLIQLNPMTYVVQGFRDCLIHQAWFWHKPWQSLYFAAFALLLLLVGRLVFRHLRPHFMDVL